MNRKWYRATFHEGGQERLLIAEARFNDECHNGHDTFALTGEIWRAKNGAKVGRDCLACGMLHAEIARYIPAIAPMIRWHLCSTDGPMHYFANTGYHASQHGPTHAWVYYAGVCDPLGLGARRRLIGYVPAIKARRAEGQPGYEVQWDAETAHTRDLDAARDAAIWPDATDEELTAPGLEHRLRSRLPQLMRDFRAAIESFGFAWPTKSRGRNHAEEN